MNHSISTSDGGYVSQFDSATNDSKLLSDSSGDGYDAELLHVNRFKLAKVYYDDERVPVNETTLVEEQQQSTPSVATENQLSNSNSFQLSDLECEVDWTKDFLDVMEKVESNSAGYQDYKKLANLANNFLEVAKSYGKIIISEVALPIEKKTIKPINIGGIAGGEKYRVQNILFKFALDWQNFYGGDEYVMKAAGHELKGLMAIYQCQIKKLHVPLMCLIDYKGYRLIAISVLPISKSDIVYGSADGGITVHADDSEICEIMKKVGEKLNLKEHLAGVGTIKKVIYGPTDIEVHKTKDGRYFVCDFARLFPPESRFMIKKGAFLYRMLRPELVRKNNVPLSSDGNSLFGYHNRMEHDVEIQKTTQRLLKNIIPTFAYNLSKLGTIEMSKLIPSLHREGINCRYLGLVRAWAHNENIRKILLTESIARICKNLIRQRLRGLMKKYNYPLEEHFRDELVQFLNLVISTGKDNTQFWEEDLKPLLLETYPECLTTTEIKSPLENNISKFDLLMRIQHLTGFELDPQILVREDIDNPVSPFEILEADVKKSPEKTKHVNIVAYAEATSLFIQGKSRSGPIKRRLFDLATKRFESAIATKPDDVITLTAWGDRLYEQYKRSRDIGTLQQTLEKWQLAESYDKIISLAGDLSNQAEEISLEKDNQVGICATLYNQAKLAYKAAIATGINKHMSHFMMANLLFSEGQKLKIPNFLVTVGEHFRASIQANPGAHHPELLTLFPLLSNEELANVLPFISNNGDSIDEFDWRWGTKINIPTIVKSCTSFYNIKKLTLKKLTAISDEDILPIFTNCIQLSIVDLQSCHLVTDKSISILSDVCHSIVSLELRGCYLVTDSSVVAISKLLLLENLGIECKNITDNSLVSLFINCKYLKTLYLYRCIQLSSSLEMISMNCNHLENLQIKWYPKMNDDNLQLLSKLPLKTLFLKYVTNITEHGVIKLIESCNTLQTIGFCLPEKNPLPDKVLMHCKKTQRYLRLIRQSRSIDYFTIKGISYKRESDVLHGFQRYNYKNASLTADFLCWFSGCKTIDFNQCTFGGVWPMLQAGLASSRGVSEIKFCHCQVTLEIATTLAFVFKEARSRINSLTLLNVGLDDSTLDIILDAYQGDSISLQSEILSDRSAQLISNWVKKHAHHIKLFSLSHTKITTVMSTLIHGFLDPVDPYDLDDDAMLSIDFTECGIGTENAPLLAELLRKVPTILSLKLSDNQLGDVGVKSLADGLKAHKNIKELYVDNINMSDSGLAVLAEGVLGNLHVLSCNKNNVSNDGVIDLSSSLLEEDCYISELSLTDNPLGKRAVKSLSIALKGTRLTKVKLSFGEEDLQKQEGLEQELILLICESLNTSCTINLGNVTIKIHSMAKVHFHSFKAKQRQEQKKIERAQTGPSWQQELKSTALARFLDPNDKDTNSHPQ